MFMLITDLAQTGTEAMLKRLYELYADFIMKNPAYTVDNVIVGFEPFDRHIDSLLSKGLQGVLGV
jgi:trafficking protein particle complex subunit 4